MFGSCYSGSAVVVAQQVDQFKYVINYPNVPINVSYITLFLLPNIPFDPNYKALVYFQVNDGEFNLFGSLNTEKQSAIYKINNNNYNPANNMGAINEDVMLDDVAAPSCEVQNINIGISIEPNAQADLLLQNRKQLPAPSPSTDALEPVKVLDLSNKIITNAYNYLSGFIDAQQKVPISRFNDWWNKFKSKLENNPKFLDNEN
ncbi:BA75_01299T0 [Komagataella pastoris]|uniref:BA75_01299T0 n=1 Tax=Komagataella pastoris TaxID=4922 RepID=A0A1B2J723_PICPA|nr:BA75_01299T0 [Komagataella pastoris]